MWDFIFFILYIFLIVLSIWLPAKQGKKCPTSIFNEQKYDAIFFNVFIIPFVSSDGFIFVDMSQ